MTPAEELAFAKPTKRIRKKVIWDCKVRDRRKSLNLTLEDVSDNVGITLGHLSIIELGGGISFEVARKLADFFGCTERDLWPKLLEDK